MGSSARLSDDVLAAEAAEWRRLKEEAADLEARARSISDRVLAELGRRHVGVLTVGGLKLTAVTTVRTTYDVEAARANVPRSIFGRITHLVVAKAAVTAEVESGRLTADQVATFATETPNAPYLRVSAAR